MAVLQGYDRFGGLHWETGSFGHALAHLGILAPHTGEPFSEAMLLGLGRGIGCFYFAFDYAGHEPYFFFNTRQTLVGGDATADLCRRLGVEARPWQGSALSEATAFLAGALNEGLPVLVWADRTRLPWGWAPTPSGPWMAPILVYGLTEAGTVHVADRARVPLTCTVDELAAAWGAQPNRVHKAVALLPARAPCDLRAGIREAAAACVEGFVGGPSVGFGLPALGHWAEMLTQREAARGWPSLFATDRLLFANLIRAYMYIELEGTGGGACRPLYADFLDEAGDLLGVAELHTAARRFRDCGALWGHLAGEFLPGPFRRTREVLLQREARFRAGGLPGLEETRRLAEYTDQAEIPDPDALLAGLRRGLLEVQAAEQAAVAALAAICI